eukprot:g29873.t1
MPGRERHFWTGPPAGMLEYLDTVTRPLCRDKTTTQGDNHVGPRSLFSSFRRPGLAADLDSWAEPRTCSLLTRRSQAGVELYPFSPGVAATAARNLLLYPPFSRLKRIENGEKEQKGKMTSGEISPRITTAQLGDKFEK